MCSESSGGETCNEVEEDISADDSCPAEEDSAHDDQDAECQDGHQHREQQQQQLNGGDGDGCERPEEDREVEDQAEEEGGDEPNDFEEDRDEDEDDQCIQEDYPMAPGFNQLEAKAYSKRSWSTDKKRCVGVVSYLLWKSLGRACLSPPP